MEYNRRYIRIISSAGTPIFIPVATNTQMGISRPDNTTIVIDNGELSVSSTVLGDITTLGETKLDKVPGGLDTTATHVVSAINELHGEINALQTVKLDKIPGGLQTTATSVVGAINELGGRVVDAEDTADVAFDLADAAKDIAEAAERAVEDKYVKPETGIPSSDLAAGVQTSLGKADTAVQSESDPTVPEWAKAENKPAYVFTEINGKPTTILGYGITDAYTKTEIDGKVSSVFKYKGAVASYSNLPTSDRVVGDVWDVTDTGKNYAWNGTGWDDLGGVVDLSNYYTKAQVDTALAGKADASHTHAAGDVDSGTFAEARIPDLPTSKITGLAAVATSGDYDDLANKPTIPSEQVNADWDATSGKAEILNKPTIPDAQIQSDWNQSTTSAKDYIKNKPTIPTVPSIASQAEAEAGTENTKIMTALRVKQAIDELAPDYTLPTASDTVLGGVKVGSGLSIVDGVLSAEGGGGGGVISSVEVLGDWS